VTGPVLVSLELDGRDVRVGTVWGHRRGRAESATFQYDPAWLEHPSAYPLDPALPLVSGPFQTAAGQALFGAMSDGAPDRWGRALRRRAELRRARAEGVTPRTIGKMDHLLGVRDDTRQGALRYRTDPRGPFLATPESGVPAMLELPRLLAASTRVERDADDEEDLRLLLRAGSSLGGARPKASVLTPDRRLAIAKFPSVRADEWDVMRWEMTALDIAADAGLATPERALIDVAGRAVLVLLRFDRRAGARLGYLSAMSMLEAADGEQHSYLEIADAITAGSAAPDADLAELWGRMALSMLISNTDDHLRNHGFLRVRHGWRLAPCFDLNPNPGPGNHVRSLAVDEADMAAPIATLLEVAGYFRLGASDAIRILSRIESAVSRWRDRAGANGLGGQECSRMEPAFEHQRRRDVQSTLNAS
jgi:serine/threonine-protein kinase HipA